MKHIFMGSALFSMILRATWSNIRRPQSYTIVFLALIHISGNKLPPFVRIIVATILNEAYLQGFCIVLYDFTHKLKQYYTASIHTIVFLALIHISRNKLTTFVCITVATILNEAYLHGFYIVLYYFTRNLEQY